MFKETWKQYSQLRTKDKTVGRQPFCTRECNRNSVQNERDFFKTVISAGGQPRLVFFSLFVVISRRTYSGGGADQYLALVESGIRFLYILDMKHVTRSFLHIVYFEPGVLQNFTRSRTDGRRFEQFRWVHFNPVHWIVFGVLDGACKVNRASDVFNLLLTYIRYSRRPLSQNG